MPAIVEASIQGKLKHPIIPDVATQNQSKEAKSPQAAGVTKITFENTQKIEASKGRPHPSPTSTTLKETLGLIRGQGNKTTAGLKEQGKGLYLSSVG